MKSEKEIKEMYEKLMELKPITHPSLLKFAEWVLDVGDKLEQTWWVEIMNGIIDAKRRSNNTKP